MITQSHTLTLDTATGPMQTLLLRPQAPGRYPALILYSEIFQNTPPIVRLANVFAGLGFAVFVPEVFHELNPLGTVLAYDDAGKDKGNQDKLDKPLEQHDSDTEALLAHIAGRDDCRGPVGAIGVCIGGHLAFRAALNPGIGGAFCLYATDLHSNALKSEPGNNSLERVGDVQGELVMVFGHADPHVPQAGRQQILSALQASGVTFEWHEVNAQHAFMRDEGERYDPELALMMIGRARDFFRRVLA